MVDAPAARASPSRTHRLLRWPGKLLRTLLRVIPQAVEGFFADRCAQHAAGIAYRVLFSLVPLSIVLVAILGLVLRDDAVRNDVINRIVDWVHGASGSNSDNIAREIEKLASPATGVGLFSLLVFGWAATGMMASLRAGLEVAMRVERGRPAVRGKLVDVLLVVGAAALVVALVLVTLAAQVVLTWIQRPLEWLGVDSGVVEQGILSGIPFLLAVGVVLLLYRFVPARRLGFGDAVAGAIVTAVLLFVISLLLGLTLQRTRSLGTIYGSLTAGLVFLYSVYLYASALLLGAEVAAAWSRPSEPTNDTLLTQVRRVVLGLFVHQDPPPVSSARPRVPTDPPPV
jgi:membrane protein